MRSIGSKIDLLGVDALLAALRQKLQKAAARVENKALRAGGQEIAESMRERVRRSGYQYTHLRDDIKVSGVRKRDGVKYVLIGPGRKTAWRGKFLEFGTSKMAARPFAEPGFNDKKDAAMERMADELRRGLRS